MAGPPPQATVPTLLNETTVDQDIEDEVFQHGLKIAENIQQLMEKEGRRRVQ